MAGVKNYINTPATLFQEKCQPVYTMLSSSVFPQQRCDLSLDSLASDVDDLSSSGFPSSDNCSWNSSNEDGKVCSDSIIINSHKAGIPDEEDGVSLLKNVLHPLQNRWCFWFFNNDRKRQWTENLKRVAVVNHVEEFWALHDHMRHASTLPNGCDYLLFKEGIEPKWEDLANRYGGRWLISLERTARLIYLDDLWLDTLLLVIGEAFGVYSQQVCGAVVSVRPKADKLCLWTRDCRDREACVAIGQYLKEGVKLPVLTQLCYQSHDDQQERKGSMFRSMYSLL